MSQLLRMTTTRRPMISREQRRQQEVLRLLRLHKRTVNCQCTYCGATGSNMRRCSLCKSVRYCDERCQRADYIARHRSECTNFKAPPFTTTFMTQPIGSLKYALATVFARGYRDGVGCWISIRGTRKASLVGLASSLSMRQSEESARSDILMAAALGGHHAHKDEHASWHGPCLLTVQVLLQNRRKDGRPVLVLPARSQAISSPHESSMQLLMQKHRDCDAPSTYVDEDCRERASLQVASSNWDGKPRMYMANFDGAEFSPCQPKPCQHPPRSVLDANRGLVVLHPGQFAVVHFQFCVGDGSTIKTEWQALRCLERFLVPCVSPWDGRDAASYDEDATAARLHAVQCAIDAQAVEDYYRDIIGGNEAAFVASHHSNAQATVCSRGLGRAAKQDRRPCA
ncbi:hypothetical protein K466DRAFT_22902 [Polyporus arcularius HHB13444]|uniref:MYND-type domain-containing protein n=1 Tax=Polyporus arcularius HHB13444 TaxID=1314778 RepID=A0A5C3PZ59_9APHY|nr:hypothetical protein K466DRAFT_22902 [Polyporus arcularius HHB13444]